MNKLLSQYFAAESNKDSAVVVAGIPEVDMGGVVAAQQDVNSNIEAISQLEHIASSINALANYAQATKADGGLDRQGAAILAISADKALAPLGITSNVPAVESFGGTTDRMTGTGFAVEDLKAKAKQAYKVIRDFIVKTMASIKKWFAELFDKVPGLIKKFEAIIAKAEKTTGTIENAKFNLAAGPASKLAIGKKVETGRLMDGLNKFEELAQAFNTTGAKEIATSIENVGKAIEAVKVEDIATVKTGLIAATTAAGANLVNVDATNGVDQDKDKRWKAEGTRVTSSDELLGGKAIFVVASAEGIVEDQAFEAGTEEAKMSEGISKIANAISKGSMKVADFSSKEVTVEAQDVETLAASVVVDHAQKMIDILENLKKNVDNSIKIEKAKETTLKALTAFDKDITDADDLKPTTKATLKLTQTVAKNNIVSCDDVLNKVIGMTVSIANGLGPVLTGSLAEHKA